MKKKERIVLMQFDKDSKPIEGYLRWTDDKKKVVFVPKK